jgi:hypothetical protein
MIVDRTMQKRTRLSTSYPRASKQPAAKHSRDALAHYVRTITTPPNLDDLNQLSIQAKIGKRLFEGKAN